jgi:hypothetical protein
MLMVKYSLCVTCFKMQFRIRYENKSSISSGFISQTRLLERTLEICFQYVRFHLIMTDTYKLLNCNYHSQCLYCAYKTKMFTKTMQSLVLHVRFFHILYQHTQLTAVFLQYTYYPSLYNPSYIYIKIMNNVLCFNANDGWIEPRRLPQKGRGWNNYNWLILN